MKITTQKVEILITQKTNTMGQMKELFIAMRESYAESSRIQREMHERSLNKEHQFTTHEWVIINIKEDNNGFKK